MTITNIYKSYVFHSHCSFEERKVYHSVQCYSRKFVMFVLVIRSIRSATRAIRESSSLTDLITSNVSLRIHEHSVINVNVSDRHLIYCNKTIIRVKTGGILQQTDILFTARDQPLASKLEVSCKRPTSYLLHENNH